VPTDFSSSADTAIESATELAQHFHSELVLLTVIPIFPETTAYDYFPEAEFLERARRIAETQFTSHRHDIVSKGVESCVCIESRNDVVGNIVTAVDREEIDMVILSTHGISGWRPLVFASIAEKVVKLVQCPILLLRSLSVDTIA
jgi:nucleotide-binding universal stress UspA family protein